MPSGKINDSNLTEIIGLDTFRIKCGGVAQPDRASDLSPYVNNQIPDFHLLPTSRINTILDVTHENWKGDHKFVGNKMQGMDQIAFLSY